MIWAFIIGCALLAGLVAGLATNEVIKRLQWWRSSLPPATRRRIKRAARAQRAHITDRAWVGQARSDGDGGPDV